jgi:HD-GYP domain-containing protein (c-di-GMP phosphodiesterase class II)
MHGVEMRLVATRRAVGLVLARDVCDGRPGGLPLLRAGVTLTSDYVETLVASGINGVYIDDELGRGIEVTPALSATARAEAEKGLARALRSAPAALEHGEPLGEDALRELESVARLIAEQVSRARDAALAFTDLAAADAYTLQHSIDVTVVGLIVARRLFNDFGRLDGLSRRSFERIDDAVVRLGVGLLLHDVGKIGVPQRVLTKPGRLDPDEWELIRQHPLWGVELVNSHLVSYHAKAVIRSHHERWNGSGYPDGIERDRIPEFARIAAVADVYDAITSERPYRAAAGPAAGHAAIIAGAGTLFDPQVVEAFRRVIAPNPPGSEVVLRDGRRAIVVSVPEGDLQRPVVRIVARADGTPLEPVDVALAEHPELALASPQPLPQPDAAVAAAPGGAG